MSKFLFILYNSEVMIKYLKPGQNLFCTAAEWQIPPLYRERRHHDLTGKNSQQQI